MMRKVELLAAVLVAAALPAMADAGDSPSRVARLSYQSGTVSFRPGTVEEWTAASLNYPLTTGDHLWADAGAEVEMHVGSTAIRMGSQTALAILNLDDQMAQLSLRPPAVQTPPARSERPMTQAPANNPAARPAEQRPAERPAQVQERKTEERKTEKKAARKAEKEPKDIR